MSAVHGTASDVQWRADEFVNPQCLRADSGADDVHQRVHRANLMELDFVLWLIVDLTLGFSQSGKSLNGFFLHPARETAA